jgi:hypothetical protein
VDWGPCRANNNNTNNNNSTTIPTTTTRGGGWNLRQEWRWPWLRGGWVNGDDLVRQKLRAGVTEAKRRYTGRAYVYVPTLCMSNGPPTPPPNLLWWWCLNLPSLIAEIAVVKSKKQRCSRLVTAYQGGQKNRNGKTIAVLFYHVFHYTKY